MDELASKLNANEEITQSLKSQLENKAKLLVERNDSIKELERQLKMASEDNNGKWETVEAEPIKVKGEENPLSNFFPCQISAFGQLFKSVEHAYQWKKAFDNNLFDVAEDIKETPTAVEAKKTADDHIGKDKTRVWEEKSCDIIKYLLEQKLKSCKEFKDRLEASKNRRIIHNVASTFWGTGGGIHGRGENRFGQLLMEVRANNNIMKTSNHQPSKTAAYMGQKAGVSQSNLKSTSEEKIAKPNSVNKSYNQTHSAKPDVLLIGNSLVNNIKADKLSREFNTTKVNAYTINEAKSVIDNVSNTPSAITFHLTTNDVRKNSPASETTSDYCSLIDTTMKKFPSTKIVISNAPRRTDDSKLATQCKLVNASLEDHYHNMKNVTFISNTDVTSLASDGKHLTHRGTSALARNIKSSVSKQLGITLQSINRSTNSYNYKSRNFASRNFSYRGYNHR